MILLRQIQTARQVKELLRAQPSIYARKVRKPRGGDDPLYWVLYAYPACASCDEIGRAHLTRKGLKVECIIDLVMPRQYLRNGGKRSRTQVRMMLSEWWQLLAHHGHVPEGYDREVAPRLRAVAAGDVREAHGLTWHLADERLAVSLFDEQWHAILASYGEPPEPIATNVRAALANVVEAQQLGKEFEARLLMPLDAGTKAAAEFDALIERYGPVE